MDDKSFFDIPIFIISYNRLDTLKQCIERYSNDGYKNLHIVDNASTNKELLEYLHQLPFIVHFLKENFGHKVVWKSGAFNDITDKSFYVVTDPDILPVEKCPKNYVEVFYKELIKHPEVNKVGFSLKIDDLPEEYIYKYDIIRYESFYWEDVIYEDGERWYLAPIDTTFAIYRPGFDYNKDFYSGIRSAAPYTARHLGWYMDFQNLSDENRQYIKSGKQYSTSVNPKAMNNFNLETIQRLVIHKKLNFFEVVKIIGSREYLKNAVSCFDLIKGCMYLILKYIYVRVIR